MSEKINVHEDIKLAETLPAKFYKDKNIFELSKKKIFLRCWHWIETNLFVKKEILKHLLIFYKVS